MLKEVFRVSILLLLTISCSNKSEITFTNNAFYIKPANTVISDVRVDKWLIGPNRRQDVSKGITAHINLPQFERKYLNRLITEFGINAWLIKVKKRSFAVNSTLGYLYIPLVVPGTQGNSKSRRHQIKQGTFSIYYTDAALSKRFERFECPAFGHDLVIDNVRIDERPVILQQLFTGPMEETQISAMVLDFSYSGNILNGGKSVVGNYTVEIAFYNHKEKTKKSNFIELVESVNVVSESSKTITGCAGFEIPPADEEVDGIKLFRWKR